MQFVKPDENSKARVQKSDSLRKRIHLQIVKIYDFLLLVFSFLSLFRKRIFKGNLAVFYTNSGDKLSRDEKGAYYNFLTDAFITEGLVEDYLYMEKSLGGDFRKPSPIEIDLKLDRLYPLHFIFRFLLITKRKLIFAQALRLEQILKAHFKSEQREFNFSNSDVIRIINSFFLEYWVAIVLLKITRPSILFCSEQTGCGLLGAANSLGVKSIDLQHGIIDQHHPQYTFSAKLNDSQNSFSLPTYLGVFGSLHKDILRANGFWNDNKIITLGSARMFFNRNKTNGYKKQISFRKKNVLIPTQYTVFPEILMLLNRLKEESLEFKLILKLHPLEPNSNIISYRRFASEYPGFIEVVECDVDIYQIISEAHVVIGFDSAVLLESVSLFRPTFTIGTPSAPRGVHEFFSEMGLEAIIRIIPINNIDLLSEVLRDLLANSNFYTDQIKEMTYWGNRLYAPDYLGNCKRFLSEAIVKRK